MKFSLIMATLGRFEDVGLFCEVLSKQTYKDFELIVVDQNPDERLTEILAPFENDFPLIHIHSDKKGLSLNRNIGLKKATGDIIAFPDDDCLYNEDTLEFVVRRMKEEDADYFCVNWHDATQPDVFRCVLEEPMQIKKRSFFDVGSSITLFVTKSVIEGFAFDEQLGVGAKYGSGEETYLLLWCLSKNAKCVCDGTYYIHHPYKRTTEVNEKRSYTYALGYGALMRKAFSVYHFHFVFVKFLFALLKNFLGIMISPRRKHHLIALKGKVKGFISYKQEVV